MPSPLEPPARSKRVGRSSASLGWSREAGEVTRWEALKFWRGISETTLTAQAPLRQRRLSGSQARAETEPGLLGTFTLGCFCKSGVCTYTGRKEITELKNNRGWQRQSGDL